MEQEHTCAGNVKRSFGLPSVGLEVAGEVMLLAIDRHLMPFHGNQNLEWQVFEFARNLNEPAAMRSISMGGPQIMGFNHSRIGYDSAREMFDTFQADIRYHVLGLFDFIKGSGTTSPLTPPPSGRLVRGYRPQA